MLQDHGSTITWTVADAVRRARRYLPLLGVRGVAAAAAAYLRGTQLEFRVARPDVAHPFWLRLPSSDLLTYRQLFGDREYEFPVVRAPRTIVDAGANIGLASIYFGNAFPGARILAVEPADSNVGLLKKNTAPYPSIEVVQAALWKEEGELELVDPGWGYWGFRTGEPGRQPPGASVVQHRVKAMTVGGLLDSCGVEYLDLLKIDVEGAEVEIFEGAASWLGRVGMLVIELHDRMRPGCSEAVYRAAGDFSRRWERGEHVYLAREDACGRSPGGAMSS